MVDPLSAKLGVFDINEPENMNGNVDGAGEDDSDKKNLLYTNAETRENVK